MTKANKNRYREGLATFHVAALSVGEKQLIEEARQRIMIGEGVNIMSNKELLMSLIILGKHSVRKSC